MLIDILGGRQTKDLAVEALVDQIQMEINFPMIKECLVAWDKEDNPFINHMDDDGNVVEDYKTKILVTRLTFMEHADPVEYGKLTPDVFVDKLIKQIDEAHARSISKGGLGFLHQIKDIDLLGCGCGVRGIDPLTGRNTDSIAEIVSRKLYEHGLYDIKVHALSEECLPSPHARMTLLRIPKVTRRGWELNGFKDEEGRKRWFEIHNKRLEAMKETENISQAMGRYTSVAQTPPRDLWERCIRVISQEHEIIEKLRETEKKVLIYESQPLTSDNTIRGRFAHDPRCSYSFNAKAYIARLEGEVLEANTTLETLKKHQYALTDTIKGIELKNLTSFSTIQEIEGILEEEMKLCYPPILYRYKYLTLNTEGKAKGALTLSQETEKKWVEFRMNKIKELERFTQKTAVIDEYNPVHSSSDLKTEFFASSANVSYYRGSMFNIKETSLVKKPVNQTKITQKINDELKKNPRKEAEKLKLLKMLNHLKQECFRLSSTEQSQRLMVSIDAKIAALDQSISSTRRTPKQIN